MAPREQRWTLESRRTASGASCDTHGWRRASQRAVKTPAVLALNLSCEGWERNSSLKGLMPGNWVWLWQKPGPSGGKPGEVLRASDELFLMRIRLLFSIFTPTCPASRSPELECTVFLAHRGKQRLRPSTCQPCGGTASPQFCFQPPVHQARSPRQPTGREKGGRK